MIRRRRILITGCAGSVGSELFRQLSPYNRIFGLDINETDLFDLIEEYRLKDFNVLSKVADIRDTTTLEDIFSEFKPEIVFHAAARKHVTPMEQTPMEAVSINITGTYNLLRLSKKYKVKKFVFISTDKVVNAESIMGATKKVAEIMVKNAGKGFICVRFANVLGSRGSVIPIWQRQIDKKEPLTITDERMMRYFMTIEEACDLVIKAAELGKGGEIFVLRIGEPIKIIDLAKKIIQESKIKTTIKKIGIRPGEKLYENLLTEEEEGRAIQSKNFYIIK